MKVFKNISLGGHAPIGEEEKKKRKKKKKKDGAVAIKASAEKVQEAAMEAEPSEQKRKHLTADCDPESTGTQKTAGKLSEKKRRRSQTVEGSESDLPAKIRKISESETGDEEKDEANTSKFSLIAVSFVSSGLLLTGN